MHFYNYYMLMMSFLFLTFFNDLHEYFNKGINKLAKVSIKMYRCNWEE